MHSLVSKYLLHCLVHTPFNLMDSDVLLGYLGEVRLFGVLMSYFAE